MQQGEPARPAIFYNTGSSFPYHLSLGIFALTSTGLLVLTQLTANRSKYTLSRLNISVAAVVEELQVLSPAAGCTHV